jgi:uncharacterized membrane protein
MSDRTEAREHTTEAPAAVSGDEAKGREYDLGRLLTFTDGVFAIAITLLVLDIPAPTVPPDQLWPALLQLYPRVIAFAISFLLVGMYWLSHHRLFRDLRRCTGTLLLLNLLLLFLVCLIPFSAAVVARYGDTVAGVEIYGGNMAGVGLIYFGLRIYSRLAGLTDGALTPEQWADGTARAAAVLAMFLVAMGVAPLSRNLSYFCWAFSAPVAGLVRRVVVQLRR